ncbi:MAG: SLOG family protein [Eubacteriales bacterium]
MTSYPPLPPKEQVCCFTGHRDMPFSVMQEVLPRLTEAVAELLRADVSTFIVGGARGFDTLVAIQLINLRRHLYPHLRLVLARPCPGQADRWPAAERALYETVRREVDLDLLLSDRYYNGCMQRRNAFMVEHSSHLLAYVTRTSGGSYQTLTLARRQGLHIENLADSGVALTFPEQQGLFDGI